MICVFIVLCRCLRICCFNNNKTREHSASWLKTRKLPTVPGSIRKDDTTTISTGETFVVNPHASNNLPSTPLAEAGGLVGRRMGANVYEPSPPLSRRPDIEYYSTPNINGSIYDSVKKLHYADLTKTKSLMYQDLEKHNAQESYQYLEMGTPKSTSGFYGDNNDTKPIDDDLYYNEIKDRSSSYSLLTQGAQDYGQQYQSLEGKDKSTDNYYEKPVDEKRKGKTDIYPNSCRKTSYQTMYSNGDPSSKSKDYEDMTSGTDGKNRKMSYGVTSLNSESCHYEVPPEVGSFHPDYFDEGNDYENDYVESYLDLTDE